MVHTKINQTGYDDALFREAEGLELLRDALETGGVTDVKVPRVVSVTEKQLEMTAITPQRQSEALLVTLGRGLATIHNLPQSRYGLDRDNYIGLNPQKNIESDNWGEFFADYRLGYQISLISNAGLRQRFEGVLNTKRTALIDWLNEHCAGVSLLHGDLWSGNVMFDGDNPWLIDPAVYYGDSEADLAMTEMFGGLGPAFYEAYQEVRPFTTEYPRKRQIYNLYHFLNHYNLFGGSYLGPCENAFALIERL